MIDQSALAALAVLFFYILGGGCREIRAFRGPRVITEHFYDAESFARRALALSEAGWDVYTNLNPLPADHPKGKAAKNADIVGFKFVLIDLDPVRWSDSDPKREHTRGGAICSTDAEHEAALAKASEVQRWLIEQGVPPDAIIGPNDSGNGAAMLLRVDIPNTPEGETLVKNFLKSLAERFSDASVKLDTSVGNPARITRVWGTLNQKEAAEDRPRRMCRPLEDVA